MHRNETIKRDELMKADLLSEIVLLGSGVAVIVAFLIVLVAAFTSAAAAMQ
jgi:hypothetical protein